MNTFVSLHGVCHNLFKVSEKDYVTVVPKGVRVYMFAPTNHCIYSNESSEEMMKYMLNNPDWTCSPECGAGGMFEHAQLYLPGNKMVNLMLDGDDPDHYGVYTLGDSFKKMPLVFDATKKETTYDVERLLQTLAPKSKTKTPINIFLCICSPHTISPPQGSVIKWRGKVMPSRKATKKYDSYHMCETLLKKAKAIQEKRLWLDEQGKLRFKKQACRRMFTRSMSFPVNMRIGSIDNIPSTIGKGVGELPAPTIEQGLYYKIDKQDRETNEVYEIKKRQI